MPRGLPALFLLCTALAQDQGSAPAADPVLRRVYARVAENLKGLPNYTCTETIERAVRRESKKNYEPVDTVRVEIAYVGGKEMVAWPGARKFEDKSIDEFVARAGAIGTGNFALHIHNLFRTAAPAFSAPVEERREGRKTIRYGFQVTRSRSAFHLSAGSKDAIVAYHGALWVDAGTLDLVRLETEAEGIPDGIGISASRDAVEYARVRIGDSDFLLPKSSELVMVDRAGTENRNRSRFSGCRQYMGESTVSFGDPEAAPAQTREPEIVRLPAGLNLEVALNAALDPAKVAIGDPISATLLQPLKKGRAVVAPKGAILSGHVTRFDRGDSAEGRFYVVGFEFASLEAANVRAEFFGNLEEAGIGKKYAVPFATDPARSVHIAADLLSMVRQARPGESLLIFRAGQGAVIPAGLRMVWQTVER